MRSKAECTAPFGNDGSAKNGAQAANGAEWSPDTRETMLAYFSQMRDSSCPEAGIGGHSWEALVVNPPTLRCALGGLLPALLDSILTNMVYNPAEISRLTEMDRLSPVWVSEGLAGCLSLRQRSGLLLDCLSTDLGSHLVSPPGRQQGWLLRELRARMGAQSWPEQEAAILALGAVARGYNQASQPLLPSVLASLLDIVSDSSPGAAHPLVRCISWWTLSRYHDTVCRSLGGLAGYLKPLLAAMGCTSRQVQESSVSAFSTLMQDLQGDLCSPELLDTVLQRVRELLYAGSLGSRALTLLMEGINHLLHGGLDANTPAVRSCLFDPVVKTVFPAAQEDDDLMQVTLCCAKRMECCIDSDPELCEEVFVHCTRHVGRYLLRKWEHARNAGSSARSVCRSCPNDDAGYLAFWLLADIIAGANIQDANLEKLVLQKVPGTELTLVDVGFLPLSNVQIMESVCGIGVCVAGQLLQRLPALTVQPAIQHLPAIMDKARHDAQFCQGYWFCGQLAVALQPALVHQYVAENVLRHMANFLVPPLVQGSSVPNLQENCAAAVGRVGLVWPQMMASELGSFVGPLLSGLHSLEECSDKEQAYMGVIRMLQSGGFAVLQNENRLWEFLTLYASFSKCSRALTDGFRHTLGALKAACSPSDWARVLEIAPPHFPRDLL